MKPSSAQKWILTVAAKGARVEAAGQYEVHASFTTGEVWYGAPYGAHRVCTRNGWLKDDLITEAGRLALADWNSPAASASAPD